ncbi:MAG: Ig-like domain-containing protein, partial [Thiotrichaceae bacterium]
MEITKTTRLLFPFILSFSLIACGGSGFSAENTTTTTTTTDTSSNPNTTDDGTTQAASKAATLEISASSAQLQSDGAIPVTISAIVKDQGNIILSDIDIEVTVDGSASVTPTTGTNIRTAQVLPGLNHPENRKLTVTVSTLDGSDLSETLEIDVTGTAVQIDGPENISLNTATDFIIKLTDSSGKGLANQTVVIESTNTQIDPVNSANSFETDINGELKVSVVAAQGGVDTINISALGASTSKTITLSGEAFVLTSDNTEVNINTHETITLTLTGNSGAPLASTLVNLVATRGQLTKASDTTDSNGHIAFGISSPTAGNTVITATTFNSGLTATLVREFVATTPASITTEAEPVLIAPLNSSTISSKVLDVNNNPVKNQKVIFNLNDTVNGNLSSSSAITNSSGRATVVYTAGDTTSALEGVQISSYVDGYAASVNDDIELTVGGNALRLILGTDNKVGTNSTTTYFVNYGVIVTDSSGNPVNNQVVEFTVTPVSF